MTHTTRKSKGTGPAGLMAGARSAVMMSIEMEVAPPAGVVLKFLSLSENEALSEIIA